MKSQAIILAAGLGTRFKSNTPKVLHHLGAKPMIDHLVQLAKEITEQTPIVIINPAHQEVIDHLKDRAQCVEQANPRGTGDAVKAISKELQTDGPIFVLYADNPLFRPQTLQAALEQHQQSKTDCTLLTFIPPDPTGFGRIIRDGDKVKAIIEERDLTPEQRAIKECNVGFLFEGAKLWPALEQITDNNAQGEYLLTDVIKHLDAVDALVVSDFTEAMGINDRRQLGTAETVLRHRVLERLMAEGVTIQDPTTTYIDETVSIGKDTTIAPMTVIKGETTIGEGCTVGPMAQLNHVKIGNQVQIGAATIEDSHLYDEVSVGQYARIRPGCVIGKGSNIGTHAEIKNSNIGPNCDIKHFSCVLDADLGQRVNVGAGTVTCNYDGKTKQRTTISDDVFVGSGSMLIAPVTIGAGAYIGAGSVISKDVPAGALSLERSEQTIKEGWVAKQESKV